MNLRLKSFVFLCFLFLAADVFADCSVFTTDLNFGGYDTFAIAALTSTGTITVSCNEAPPPVVMISIAPSFHSGLFDPRQMRNTAGSDRLTYNLYTNAGRTSIWGDGTGGTTFTILKNVTKNKPRTGCHWRIQ